MDKKIEIMQNNLVHIRKCLGISAATLGNYIGVTKQTISNIESGRYKLTKTTYLAILYVLDNDIFPNITVKEKDFIQKLLCVSAYKIPYEDSLKFKEESQ